MLQRVISGDPLQRKTNYEHELRRSCFPRSTFFFFSIGEFPSRRWLTNGILQRFDDAFGRRQLLSPEEVRDREAALITSKKEILFFPFQSRPVTFSRFFGEERRDGTLPSGSLLNPQYDSGESSFRFSFSLSLSFSPLSPVSSSVSLSVSFSLSAVAFSRNERAQREHLPATLTIAGRIELQRKLIRRRRRVQRGTRWNARARHGWPNPTDSRGFPTIASGTFLSCASVYWISGVIVLGNPFFTGPSCAVFIARLAITLAAITTRLCRD